MGRERWKWEHTLPRFPFHCYTNPKYYRVSTKLANTYEKACS